MNFYKHHLGDYDGATAHLSWEEDMAYTRLLRSYYRREQPIPAAEACRLVRATSAAQKRAVETVLAEFFERRGDLWHNKRADQEIEAYQLQAATNRRIAKGRSGQRTVNESSNEPSTNRSTIGRPNHKPEPDTKNQKNPPNPPVAASPLPPWLKVETWTAYVKTRPARARTPDALKSALEKLEKFRAAGHDPNEIVATSLSNGWQGLFPPNARRGVGGPAPDYSSLVNQ